MFFKICLLLASMVYLSRCTTLEDCKTATTECCDLAVENLWTLKLNNVKVDVTCDVYWQRKQELFSNFSFKNYNCGTWTCDCPNFEQKFRDISRVLFEKEADSLFQHCKPQASDSGATNTGLKYFVAILVFHAALNTTSWSLSWSVKTLQLQLKSEIQNLKFENCLKSRIRNLKSKSKIWNSKSEIRWNLLKSDIRNLKSEIRYLK